MKILAWFNFALTLLIAVVGTLWGIFEFGFSWSPSGEEQGIVIILLALASIPHIVLSKKVINRLKDSQKSLMTKGIQGLSWYTIVYVISIIVVLFISLPFRPYAFLLDIVYQFGDIRDHIILSFILLLLIFVHLLFAVRILYIQRKNMRP